MSRNNKPAYLNVPNDRRTWVILDNYPLRLKLMQSFVMLLEEVRKNPAKYQNIPGPYFSLIRKHSGVSNRTALVNLNQLEKEGTIKHHDVIYEVGGRKQIVKVYEPTLDMEYYDWLKDVKF